MPEMTIAGTSETPYLEPTESDAAERYRTGILSHDLPTERHRLHLLEQMHDPDTIRVLNGLDIAPSWRCLELGAGAGSMARWLATHCPAGHVVATDTDPQFLDPSWAPNLEVRQHDVVQEDFPPASFDLIHMRALLVNLPEREVVLAKTPTWLVPGGWLVVEEPALFPADSSPYPALRRLLLAFEQTMADSHGFDARWPRRLPAALAATGLVEVNMDVSPIICGNDGAPDAFFRLFFEQLQPALTRPGLLTEAEFEAGLMMFDEPSFVDMPAATISAWGRRV